MYGCLVKFAVKCGRDDLSELLFNATLEKPQVPQLLPLGLKVCCMLLL